MRRDLFAYTESASIACPDDPDSKQRALSFALEGMARTAGDARLVVVYVPAMAPRSERSTAPLALLHAIDGIDLTFLDLTQAIEEHYDSSCESLTLEGDGFHPGPAGHALIASNIDVVLNDLLLPEPTSPPTWPQESEP